MNKELIIIGAGGHGLVVADIAKQNGYQKIAFLDDNKEKVYDYPIIGNSSEAVKYRDSDFFVAIGNNSVREHFVTALEEKDINVISLIHPSSIIAGDVVIGNGTVIMAGAVVNCKSKIGKGVILNTGCTVDHENIIGDYVHLSPGCHTSGQVVIQKETWLGTGSIVINNVEICERCTIGAGCVVISDLSQPGTYVGVPARRI